MREPKVLIIVGQTATGKSGLAVKLAKSLNGELISADSRQVYKGLDVGTGKITKKEMRGVPHYLLDVANPKKYFSAAQYKTLAEKALEKILKKNKLPIIVGGTGFYIDALRMSLPEVPPNKKLREKLAKKSAEELYKMLGHRKIDKHNKVRLIRALEIKQALGKIPKIKEEAKYEFVFIGIKPADVKERIYKRILKRLDGIIKEGKKLHKNGLSWKRMHELGLEYRYVALYLQKKISKEEMVQELFKAIKQYARRQMTWFKRNKKIKWFSSSRAASQTMLVKLRRR